MAPAVAASRPTPSACSPAAGRACAADAGSVPARASSGIFRGMTEALRDLVERELYESAVVLVRPLKRLPSGPRGRVFAGSATRRHSASAIVETRFGAAPSARGAGPGGGLSNIVREQARFRPVKLPQRCCLEYRDPCVG